MQTRMWERSQKYVKTKFRVGYHPLRGSAARMERVRNATCPCCDAGVSETIHHTVFECKAFSDERDAFLSTLCSICPDAQSLSDEYRMRFLMGLMMGDALPREIENSLYRYLITVSTLRLGILTEQGEGS